MDKLKQLLQRIDELKLNERGLILLGVILVCYFSWANLLMSPLDQQSVMLQQKIEQKNREILALKQQTAAIVTRSTRDPDAGNKQQLQGLKLRHQQADQALTEATEHLIAADSMSKVLEDVLLKTQGLKFVSMKGLGVAPLIEPLTTEDSSKSAGTADTDSEEKDSVIGAFKHGLKLEFEGGYHETLAYLRALEELQWSFFWHTVNYRVEQYPTGKASITVYTLSLKDGWIDV